MFNGVHYCGIKKHKHIINMNNNFQITEVRAWPLRYENFDYVLGNVIQIRWRPQHAQQD